MADTTLDVGMAREALQGGLAMVSRALPSKAVHPVLTNVLVETTPHGVSLTATDLDQSIRTEVAADTSALAVNGKVAVALPGKRLGDIVREMPPGVVRLEGGGQSVHLKAGRSKFKLLAAAAAEFPSLPEIPFGQGWRINAHALGEAISRTAFAVSTEESRPIFNGVLIELTGPNVRLVATDSHRLALYDIPGAYQGGASGEKHQVIVPPAGMETMRKLIERVGETDTIELAQAENHLGVRVPGTEMTTRLITGPYPNYTMVIPQQHPRLAVLEKGELVSLVKRLATVTGDRRRIFLEFGADRCVGEVQEADIGEAADECPLIKYEAKAGFEKPVKISFNVDYLLDVLRYMPGDTLSISLKESVHAAVFRPVDQLPRQAEYLCLVMPLRLEQ